MQDRQINFILENTRCLPYIEKKLSLKRTFCVMHAFGNMRVSKRLGAGNPGR